MTAPRNELTISLEEEVPASGEGAPRRLRLSSTLHAPEGKEISAEEVREAVRLLEMQMAHARQGTGGSGPAEGAPRPDRPLDELVETYRPRSLELIDALLWEGEVTPTEHEALKAGLGKTPAPKPSRPPASVAPTTSRPAAPPPSAGEAAPARFGPPRPTDTLVKELDLKNIRDVNVARAKRLISFDEWSALKAHFDKLPAA